MALGTLLLRFGAEVLNFLEFMAALGAAVGIQRQGSFLSGNTSTTVSIVPGAGKFTAKGRQTPLGYLRGGCRPYAFSDVQVRRGSVSAQFALIETEAV